MQRLTVLAAAFLLAAGLASRSGAAADYRQATLADGTRIDYALVLPAGFDPDETYPAILAFPPGPQTRAMVEVGLSSYWEAEARTRGYIVISPVAPNGDLFFRGSAALVPEFLDLIAAGLPVAGGRFHVAGISNGGLSAFRAAIDHPERFVSLTAIPGFPPAPGDIERLEALSGMTVTMFAGELDPGWAGPMQRTAAILTDLGHEPHFEILPGEGHVMRAIAGPGAARLFDLLPR